MGPVDYAISLGLVFGGVTLLHPLVAKTVPAALPFVEGMMKNSKILRGIIGVGGVIGAVMSFLIMGNSIVLGLVVLAGSLLAVLEGAVVLFTVRAPTAGDAPTGGTWKVPVGLSGIAYGLLMLVIMQIL